VDEKLEIARRYLVRRQLEANGLKAEQAEIDVEALKLMIEDIPRGRRSCSRAGNRQGVRYAAYRSPKAVQIGLSLLQRTSLPFSANPFRERDRDAHSIPVSQPDWLDARRRRYSFIEATRIPERER